MDMVDAEAAVTQTLNQTKLTNTVPMVFIPQSSLYYCDDLPSWDEPERAAHLFPNLSLHKAGSVTNK